MLFNSLDFAIFLPIVFVLYWIVLDKKIRFQNILLLIASYVFYGWWDEKFLLLIILSTLVDFFVGLQLSTQENNTKRRLLLWTSILFNLGLLSFFKYSNFFIDNFREAFSFMGYQFNTWSLKIILPVGISFYTFQTLSYTIDVYRKNISPTKNFIVFASFVSFFPQLVAGPIERAKSLLPQFSKKRIFNYNQASEGLKQILWGLFKKIVIADNCAEYVNIVFDNPSHHDASVLMLGAILFAFQIYGDFSGYSDIAIGSAKLFGFKLMQNFAYPYFSRNIAEFWRRWHISLSTWFRDYVYIPLGGSKGNKLSQIRNVFIIFILSGFWHGANWTFIFWGFLNALFFLPLLLTKRNRLHLDSIHSHGFISMVNNFFKISATFFVTVIAWIFFRADNLSNAFQYIYNLASPSIFTIPKLDTTIATKILLLFILFMLIIEWISRKKEFGLSRIFQNQPQILRWVFYSLIICLIGLFMPTKESPFIYFQF
tara:strand:- start:17467 stop:18918 length:1452 start_codon:yes stop_codon:yes gene_type:complete